MRLSDFLQGVGRPVAYYPGMARMLDDMKEAIFICQMAYWKDKGGDPDGWIYKTADEIEDETALTYKEQIGVRAGLRDKKLLEEQHKREEHRIYFRVDWDAVNDLWDRYVEAEHMTNGHMPKCQVPPEHMTDGDMPPAKRSGGTCPKVISLNSNSEITTDTTTENDIWEQVSEILKVQMAKKFYRETVECAVPISCESGVLVVEEPNEAARELAESRLTPTIRQILVGILDRSDTDVRFVLRAEVSA